MGDWISDLLIFSAGIAGGVLISMIGFNLTANRRRRTELVSARTAILADMKQHHDKEILHAAFRTTEDIRDELDRSLATLRKTLTTVLDPPVVEPPAEQRDRLEPIAEQIKPH